MSFEWWKRLSALDRTVVGGATLAVVALFLPWWAISGGLFSVVISVDGWSAGFTAWAGGLLLGAAGLLVLRRSSASWGPLGGLGSPALVPVVSALGLLLVIVRWASLPRHQTLTLGGTYSTGARYGIYVALIAGIAETAASVLQIARAPAR